MLKNISIVLTGTVIAQLIGLAAMPLLTRLYSPEDFGRYQVYVSTLNVLLVIVAFRYEFGLFSAKNETTFRHLIALVLRISLSTSAVTALVIWFGYDLLKDRLGGLSSILFLLAPAMLVGGFYQALSIFPIRSREYGLSAKSKLSQSVGFVGASLGFALGPFSAVGMVVADIVGRLVGTATIIGNKRSLLRVLLSSPPRRALRIEAVENRQFPLLTFPGTFLSALVGLIPTLAFAQLFGNAVIGQYALVERFVLLPVGIIAVAVGQVFTGDFASEIRDQPEKAYASFKRVVLTLMSLGLPASVAGFFILPFAVPLVFGHQWALAGELAAWAMPVALSTFVAAPVHMTLVVSHNTHLQLRWEIGRFLLMLAAFFVLQSSEKFTPEVTMATLASTNFFAYMAFLLVARQALARKRSTLQ